MNGISLKECGFLFSSDRSSKNKSEFEEAKFHLESFITWLFQDFLIQLIRSYFYATESISYRNKMFYFRKDVWKCITAPFLGRMQQEMFFEEDLGIQRLASCKLRLIPKGETFRPVMNLWKKQGKTRATAVQVRNVLEILNHEVRKRPELLGAGTLSFDEIARRLSVFKRDNKCDYLYMVKLDVRSCFDSIPHEKLLEVLVHRVLPKDEYTIQKYDVVKNIHGKPFKLFKKYACSASDYTNLSAHLGSRPKTRRKPTSRVIVDKVIGTHLDRSSILAILHDHICCNYVKIGERMCVQRVGIPQGSILSSMLCSLLYGDLDRSHLGKFIDDPGSLFLRFIDDMIFVTDSYMKASELLETFATGFPEYGVEVNFSKTTSNFFHPLVSRKLSREQG